MGPVTAWVTTRVPAGVKAPVAVNVTRLVAVWVKVPVVVPVMPPTVKVPVVAKVISPLACRVTGPVKVKLVPPSVNAIMVMVPVSVPPAGPLTLMGALALPALPEKLPVLTAEKKLSVGAVATMLKR